jgi:hypothetical protein
MEAIAHLVISEPFNGTQGLEAGDWDIEPNAKLIDKLAETNTPASIPLYTAPPPPQWISVETALPAYLKNVLVEFTTVHGTPQQTTAQLHSIRRHAGDDSPYDDRWYVTVAAGHQLKTVTHWKYFDAVQGGVSL